MPVTVRLEHASKKSTPLGTVIDHTDAIVRLGHEAHGESPLELLQYVDPYGDTVFNEQQMPAVIRDLRRLRAIARSDEEKDALDEVEKLAALNMSHHSLYLWFYGD